MSNIHLVVATDGVLEGQFGSNSIEIVPPRLNNNHRWMLFVDGFSIDEDGFPSLAQAKETLEARLAALYSDDDEPALLAA